MTTFTYNNENSSFINYLVCWYRLYFRFHFSLKNFFFQINWWKFVCNFQNKWEKINLYILYTPIHNLAKYTTNKSIAVAKTQAINATIDATRPGWREVSALFWLFARVLFGKVKYNYNSFTNCMSLITYFNLLSVLNKQIFVLC